MNIEVIGYASPGQVEILRRLPRTGSMKVKGCSDGRYTEPVVLLSAARSSLFAAVIRCEQAGAFKMCMECGYQDGHDPICRFHAGNRVAQGQGTVPDAEAAQSAPDDVFEEGQWWLVELDSIVANGTPDQRRAMAVVRNLLSCWQRVQAAAVPKGWSIQRVFNPSGYTIQMPDGGFLRITDFGGGGVETAFAKFICAMLAASTEEVKDE